LLRNEKEPPLAKKKKTGNLLLVFSTTIFCERAKKVARFENLQQYASTEYNPKIGKQKHNKYYYYPEPQNNTIGMVLVALQTLSKASEVLRPQTSKGLRAMQAILQSRHLY